MSEKIIFAYQHSKDSQPVPILKRECPNYRVYRLTPDRLVPDGKVVEEILMTIAAVMDNPLKLQDRCIVYNPFQPVFYEILYSKGKIYFNYVLPEMYQDVIVNKIKTIYKASSLVEIQDYYNCFNNKYYCSFIQKNHYLFSLNVDYRENGIIEGFLSMLNNLQANDQVLFQIGIIPLNDNWKIQWKRAYEKYKDGESLNIHSSIPVMVMDKVFGFTEGLLSVMDMILGEKHEQHKKEENIRDISNFESGRYSRMTRQKVNYSGYQVQMKLFSSNNDTCYYYSKIMDGIFKVLDAEQEITINKIKINRDTERKFDFQVNKNIFSTKELSCFLQMPNRRMQTEYKAKMDSIGTVETKIPKQLLNGSIPIGETSYKGEKIMTYWNTKDKDIAPMHRVITGLQRTGKSSYIKNFAIDAIRAGHSCFVIDTIKDLSVANDIRDYMPQKYQDKIIVLDFGDIEHLLPLAWNEFKLHESDPRKKLMLASMLAGNFEYFIETVGELRREEDKLTPKMKKYLSCACKLVMSQKDTTIKDIIDTLIDYKTRHKFIKASGLPEKSTIIQELLRLDDKGEGTNYREISGIVDRASVLTNDYMIELLLSVPPNDNINFRYWADNGYCVLLKLSELNFSRVALKSLVTFIYSKIWLSMLSRGEQANPRLTHVILDEVHNFPQVTEMLKLNCREAAKYGLSYCFTSHLLKDLKGLLPFIKGSGASFMLFKTTKENIQLLKEELEMNGFTLEDCLQIKDYHTMNIINYDRDYVCYQSKVVDLVSKRYSKYDRSYLDLQCSKKYGYSIDNIGV